MRRASLLIITAIFGSTLMLVSCSSPLERTPPKFAGRLLFLNDNGAKAFDLVELTAADPSTLTANTITGNVLEAAASADQTQLVYSTKDQMILRDLHTGAAKSVAQGPSYCLTWAPDAKHFSYQQKSADGKSTKLYIADLDFREKLIWEDTSGLESAPGRCAQWIAADRIVFDRFVGMVLKNVVGQTLKPNTTTVANVGDAVKFSDTPRKLTVRAACPSGTVFLTPADEPNPMQIASRVDRLDKLSTVPGPSEGQFIGFAAKSCVPFFVSQSLSSTTDLFSLNPTNWQRLKGASIEQTFSPNARFVIKSSARLMIAGDAPNKLLLIDTESGGFVTLAPPGVTIQSPIPVVWIDN